MPKQRILPFFLPMQGCDGQCVYCDQQAISGKNQPPALAEIRAALAKLEPGSGTELAYYGGSFTCLPKDTQHSYLTLAQAALADGRLSGLRISTRPDGVDAEVCAWLKQQSVSCVELGVQSFDDQVLAAVGRGYTAQQARAGAIAVSQAGLVLGLQLMTGLPLDTPALSLYSMQEAIACGPGLLRIYPTLVLKNTQLARLYQAGAYQPQTLGTAIDCCLAMAKAAIAADIPIQRLGLNPSPSLEAALLAGPYHPAFGGLVWEALKKEQLQELLHGLAPEAPALLVFPKSELPLVFGQKRQTMLWLSQNWPNLALMPDQGLPAGELLLQQGENKSQSSLRAFCRR